MNSPQQARQFAAETHACAMQMMENAAYIQKEIPALNMPEHLRTQIEELCANLISTKHDMIHELGELDGFLATAPRQIEPWMERLHRWMGESIVSIHRCVQAVDEAVTNGTASDLALMLVMESAANIMNAVPTLPDIENADEYRSDISEQCSSTTSNP